MMDGRRRRWVALDVEFTANPLGSRIRSEFGNEGLAVWAALLAAAKRSPNQGIVSYVTEADFWGQLGLEPAAFEVEDFLGITGRQKETGRRRRGDVTDVILTRWEDLQHMTRRALTDVQQPPDTPSEDEEKPTSDPEIMSDDQDRDQDQTGQDPDQTLDRAGEGEAVAIEEALRESQQSGSDIQDHQAVGRHRYAKDPTKYDAIAEKQKREVAAIVAVAECECCDERGLRWIDDKTQAKCSHICEVTA